MPRRFARVLFSLLLLVPSPSFGQGPLRKVLSGYIREEGSGHVITSVHLELQNAMGTPISSTYSDGNGEYEFDDMGAGDCYVVAEHKGYITFREFVRPDASGHVYKDVYLRPEAPDSAPKSVSPVSEHQLSIPPKAREFFDKGIQLVVEKSDYRGAVAQFARAISKYPSYYEAYAAMGLAQNKMGDAVAAEASLRKSIDLSLEKYPQAMIDLASMFNGRKRFAEAEPLLRKVISLDASSWRAQFELAVALSGQQRFKDAVTSASAARDLKPDNPQIYLLLYNLHIQTDDFPAALHDTESYLKLIPDGATADRVRRMQDQVRKALNSSRGDPTSPSPATPPAPQPESPVGATASVADSISSSEGDAGPGSAATPVAAPPQASDALSAAPPSESAVSHDPNSLIPTRVDEFVPEVALDVPCSLSSVLQAAGQRAEQLLSTLQKFDASERVEHYKLNKAGVPGAADVRSFEYIVLVSHDPHGGFALQEYRDGSIVRPEQFPSGILTANLTAHGLIFHPLLATGFRFTCEGLGEWKGHPTWLVQFEEKHNEHYSFRSYDILGVNYPVWLSGRAWIDAGTFQVLRLESDLQKPVEKIHLTREHISIEFGSVQFRTHTQQLWLPQTAELFVELNGHRFYRRHTFSNFKIFSTDSAQQISGPKDSYCLTNTTELPITGVLIANSLPGKALRPVSLTLSIPAKGTVCKSVGVGKDLNIPLDALASASFTHDGPAGSVQAEAYLPDRSALVQVTPNSNVPVNQDP